MDQRFLRDRLAYLTLHAKAYTSLFGDTTLTYEQQRYALRKARECVEAAEQVKRQLNDSFTKVVTHG